MQADFLKKRADEFLKTADYHIREKMYPLAAFDLEQALQLYLKYYLFLRIKDYPKVHSLRELLTDLGKAYQRVPEVEKIKEENVHLIADLDQAYITARYLPAEFTKTQVENMKNWVEDFIRFLKTL